MNRKGEDEVDYGSGSLFVRGPKIGNGIFGSVYMATSKNHKLLPSTMAVKSAEVSFSHSLKKERRVLRNFEGSFYIIQCFGEETTSCQDGKMVYNLFLEYAAGGTLADRITKSEGHGLPEEETRHYTRCILEGLKEIHESGYVHCDLKPDNILLVTDTSSCLSSHGYIVKIADFGEAKKRVERDSIKGSPMYLSSDAPFDIWALGHVVHKMLTGKSASFQVEETKLLVNPDKKSNDGKDFLECCLPFNPAKRLTALELLNHKFIKQVLEGEEETKAS